MRNLELPGRSPVHAAKAAAATSHTLATVAALDTLRAGGNAIDAAVAACAVQCVVEPESTSIGGDCFAQISLKGSDDIIAYNGSGRAPGALTAEWLLDQGVSTIKQTMPHAVTVPGAVEAWARMVGDHGRLSLAKVLEPAIRYAREGFPVYSRVSVDFAAQESLLRADPMAFRTYMPGGKMPRVGDIIKQPELADTLQRIAEEGPAGFYTGPVAEDMVTRLRELGGVHTVDDFAAHAGDYVTPIRTNYRGHDVLECPPNGQGIVALIMLNILAGYDLAGMDPLSVERLHLEMEASRLAYHDRNTFVADPAFGDVPVEALLSEQHAADLRALIRMDRTLPELPVPSLPKHSDTVYLTVVDEERNAVSLICSVFHNFGSGIVSPKTGVLLQNRGCGFVVKPGHPNCVAPNKRPMHTIIPGMVVKDGPLLHAVRA